MLLGTAVNCTLAAILLFLLASQFAESGAVLPADQHSAEAAAATSPAKPPMLSDREKAGLHGPVEECTVESTTSPGPNSRAWRMVTTTKYDPDGRMYQSGYVNNDGSKGMGTLTYDAQGHLLSAVGESKDGVSATIYNYDAQGRLIGITGERDRSTTFEYDEQGRKTRIVKSDQDASSSGANHGGFGVSIEKENTDLLLFPPAGATVKTSFDENDQPIEAVVYAANGDVMSRVTRAYDAKGRVTESSAVIESFNNFLPPKERARLAADPAASEELDRVDPTSRRSARGRSRLLHL
jgi:YD repeat-containing protein